MSIENAKINLNNEKKGGKVLIFFQEIVLQLFLWMLKLIDGLMSVFSAVSGVAKVNYRGESVNIIELVVGDSTVGTIFWCIFVLAVGLTCIFTIVALVKNMIANNQNVSSIVGKFFLSLLGTIAMLAVVILGILISGAVLQLIAEIFQIGNTTKLSNALFDACVGDWVNGYSIDQINVTDLSVSKLFGSYKTALFGIWPTDWKCNGMVNPNTFMYLPAMIASIAVGVALIVAIINLAKRVYEIVFLYVAMPLSMSTLSLDDGARFKNWRESFITKILLAYGAVFSVNVFALLLPIIMQVRLPGAGSFTNSVFRIFMIVGGAMVIPAGQTLFARLFGQADDMHAGGNFLHTAFYGGRIASALTIGAAAKLLRGTVSIGKRIANRKGKSDTDEKGNDDDDKYSDDSGGATEEFVGSDAGDT